MIWMILVALGGRLAAVGAAFKFGFRWLPPDLRDLARRPIREGVKALGYGGVRLRPLQDWDARSELARLGMARALALGGWFVLVGLGFLILGAAAELLM